VETSNLRYQGDLIRFLTKIRREGYTDKQQIDLISLISPKISKFKGVHRQMERHRETDTDGYTDREQGDLISILLFVKINKLDLKIYLLFYINSRRKNSP
jgi:hypothetical protein